ncbi:hypothetical protein TrLO_g5849 [Triparma laevis f. longispina]|uniref:Uncharacterized protein n=1 Tax=Triparma laevis f. longispina TaxID=1714387 RepID=A0A9W6ZEM0_9STRA|nr:hypothetical protein TrLO_g5849 [Triparma laevis f. longispina]
MPPKRPPTKRLSLLERQNKILEDSGFSEPPPIPKRNPKRLSGPSFITSSNTSSGPSSGLTFNPSSGFKKRQEEALKRKGQENAGESSRSAEVLIFDDDDASLLEDIDGGASVGGRSMMSHAPSLHPSIAQSQVSMACSEVTIGAGDNTGYWDFAHRVSTKNDLGHNCRECKLPFGKLGEPMTERRGARTSMRYHAECFSGFADPRSQANSSMHVGNLANTQMEAAPRKKAGSKMRSSRHFEKGGHRRSVVGSGGEGKIAAFAGGMGFANGKSSKGVVFEALGAAEHGGLSMAMLEEHTKRMALMGGGEKGEEEGKDSRK